MKFTIVLSVLIFTAGINSAVFLHHFYEAELLNKKHANNYWVLLPYRTGPDGAAGMDGLVNHGRHLISVEYYRSLGYN